MTTGNTGPGGTPGNRPGNTRTTGDANAVGAYRDPHDRKSSSSIVPWIIGLLVLILLIALVLWLIGAFTGDDTADPNVNGTPAVTDTTGTTELDTTGRDTPGAQQGMPADPADPPNVNETGPTGSQAPGATGSGAQPGVEDEGFGTPTGGNE